jgi:hypothetical protein
MVPAPMRTPLREVLTEPIRENERNTMAEEEVEARPTLQTNDKSVVEANENSPAPGNIAVTRQGKESS